jgi:predicted nucleic acid-binding protein
MYYNKYNAQVNFVETIFNSAEMIHSNENIISLAKVFGKKYGLSALDALHVASAIEGQADEMITFEKISKPMFRIPSDQLLIVSLT